MHLRVRFIGISLAALLLLAPAMSAFAETVVVQMTTVNFEPRFVPSELTIRPGDTVRWVNVDPYMMDHSTSSGTGSADPLAGTLWNSGTIRTGEFFEHIFAAAGDFAFFSIPHEFEGMFGVVHVTTSLGSGGIESSTWGRLKAQFEGVLPKD